MKVRLSAFQLTYGKHLNFDTLYSSLRDYHRKRVLWSAQERVLRVEKDGDQILGSLITDRGIRAFVTVDREDDSLTKGTLGKQKAFAAFSFFVVCRKRPAAIITSYKDAGGHSFVFGVAKKLATEYLHNLRDQRLKEMGELSKARAVVVKEYAGDCLDWVEYTGRKTYEAVLREWKKIKAIEIKGLAKETATGFLPLDGEDFKSLNCRINLDPSSSVSSAVQKVKRVFENRDQEAKEVIKVFGDDDFGLSRMVEIKEEIPSLMGDLDHDQIVGERSTFNPDLKMSFVIRHLQHLIQSHPGIFG